MVTVFLRGGLGNQMFQYAIGLSLAKKNNTALALDTVFLNDRLPRPRFTYRTYDLDIFTIKPQFTRISEFSNAVPLPGVWLGLDFAMTGATFLLGDRTVIREKQEGSFDPAVLNAPRSVFLWGRWQSEKYFRRASSEVRDAFQFRIPLEAEAAVLAKEVQKTNAISVHVRRGDYATFKNVLSHMGSTDLAYYRRALSYIATRVNNPSFFVFSDDIEWCKKKMPQDFPLTFVDPASAGFKGGFHLQLMSLCKHHIIANSTFSWWGAWLDRNPQKIVVAPRRWYADARKGDDIVPERWIRL